MTARLEDARRFLCRALKSECTFMAVTYFQQAEDALRLAGRDDLADRLDTIIELRGDWEGRATALDAEVTAAGRV